MSTVEQGSQQILDKTGELYKNGPNRQTTFDFKNLLRIPNIAKGEEAEISAVARNALAYLRITSYQGIYNSQYGRQDIIEGLGEIDHPSAQAVVVESLQDPSPNVVQAAERILLDPKRYIHPETLSRLLDHKDPKVKELGLRIVQLNPRGGIMPSGNVDVNVLRELHVMMTTTPDSERQDYETPRRGAILTSLLQERTNGKIPETETIYAEDVLENYIRERISRLSEPNTFAELVTYISALNETSARTAANIETLPLGIPEQLEKDPEELEALIRLRPRGSGKLAPRQAVVMYKSLVALMKQHAREGLPIHVARIKAQEDIRRKQLQLQADEANRLMKLQLQRDQERQAQIRREQRTAELELVRKARQWFPHL